MKSAVRADRGGTLLFYGGPSMYPLLRANDLLEVEPCGGAGALPGDVIVFRHTDDAAVVVHRVVAAGADGLITRGDNNDRADDSPVRASDIVGRVTTACRGAKRIAIAGGRRGLLIARLLRLRRACKMRVARLARRPYRLVRGGVARLPLPARVKPRAVVFSSGGVSVTRLVRRWGSR